MKYQSFNSFLLTTVVRNFRLGIDPQSLLKRHQTLSIIYMNLAYIFMGGGFELLSIIFGYGYHHLVPIVALFTISSLLCLRNGRNDYATLIAIMYAHISNAFISHWGNTSMGALTAVFMLPNFSFFMCSSTKVHYINIGICVLQVCGHLSRIVNVFRVTVNADQKDEITNLVAGAIPCFIFLCFSLVVQKSVENSIWQAALSTQEKNEKINREIMQAVESKDAFISSLSHEIRNPLNAMNGSINYLLHVVHDSKLQQVLQNARISGETLLVLFTNLLDAAKLKSEKMELYYNDTNIYETLKRVLIINCENIKQKKIFVDVLVDQTIPQIIQSDGARLLQILMNLLSNAIKFTPEEGKIVICATLCHKNSTKETLEAQLVIPALNNAGISWPTQHDETQSDISNTSISTFEVDNDFLLTEEFTQEEISIRLENIKRMRSLKNNESRQSSSRYRKFFGQNEPWRITKTNLNADVQENAQSLLESDLICIQDYYLKIQITDSGCGIADENISKLFEMFTQAHNRVTSSHGGTGLGLWICKQLCQKMGGDIKLYSKLNEGTSFVFYLPVSNRGLFETQASRSEIATTTINNNVPNQFLDKTYCLVVDDLSYNRELHKLLLEREGVQVIVGCDGEEAIEKYLANLGKVDFIFMDVQMPKMDGFTAARKIRELEAKNRWKRVDIYFVSGEYYNEEEVMASFRTQKGEDRQALRIQSLKKPIDIEMISKITAKYTKKG